MPIADDHAHRARLAPGSMDRGVELRRSLRVCGSCARREVLSAVDEEPELSHVHVLDDAIAVAAEGIDKAPLVAVGRVRRRRRVAQRSIRFEGPPCDVHTRVLQQVHDPRLRRRAEKFENVIQSEVAQRAPRVRVATKRTTDSPAAAAFFCSSAPADQTLAACARSTVGCARKQADLVDQVGDATPCQPASTAVCFTAMDAGGTTIESCHPGAASCAKQEARARADAVTLRDVTACAVAP